MIINENYQVVVKDKLNVVLQEKKIRKANEKLAKKGQEVEVTETEIWVDVSYHPNVESALRRVIDLELIETGLDNIKAVIDKIEALKAELKG